MTGTLSLLTALIAALASGGDSHADNPGFIAHPAATRWAFLLSAAGWLLALVAVWRAGLAGTAAGRGVRWGGSGCRGALRRVGRRCRDAGQRRHGAERSYRHRGDAADWHTAGRTPWRLLCLRRAA
ncbi:hypothetical protein J4734_14445 [Klebsiella pneumoniae]|uniref:Uncharacterized protein n=1 Tax=Klebsiella pneumoniae TaxID=573 RepID=A0A939SVL2_KLEPN|nr:hypothetical protein [Klebsiella pneumoniae]